MFGVGGDRLSSVSRTLPGFLRARFFHGLLKNLGVMARGSWFLIRRGLAILIFFVQALSESGMCSEFPESSKKIWRYLEATQIKTDERERHKYFRHISKVGCLPHDCFRVTMLDFDFWFVNVEFQF